MGFTVLDWSTLSEITSTKMKQMMDNDQYLKDSFTQGATKLGYATKTSSQASLSADTTITGLAVAASVGTARILRIQVFFRNLVSSSGPGVYGVRIKEDGTLIQECFVNILVDAAISSVGMGGTTITAITAPSAGTHTYTVSVDRKTGTGTATLEAAATYPAIITVEDLGT